MTRYELLAFFQAFILEQQRVMTKKQYGYGNEDNAFANFDHYQQFREHITREDGVFTRMVDKFRAVDPSMDDPYDDLIDLANYCCIMAAMFHEQFDGYKSFFIKRDKDDALFKMYEQALKELQEQDLNLP